MKKNIFLIYTLASCGEERVVSILLNELGERYIITLLKQDYKALKKKSRQKIIERFSINTMVNNTENEIIQCAE